MVNEATDSPVWYFPVDLVNLDACTKAFEQHNLQNTKNENYIGVRDMVNVLNSIYASIEAYKDKINVPFCVDLTLNWLLNVYDRWGFVVIHYFPWGEGYYFGLELDQFMAALRRARTRSMYHSMWTWR